VDVLRDREWWSFVWHIIVEIGITSGFDGSSSAEREKTPLFTAKEIAITHSRLDDLEYIE
jgi:hypothetical protein